MSVSLERLCPARQAAGPIPHPAWAPPGGSLAPVTRRLRLTHGTVISVPLQAAPLQVDPGTAPPPPRAVSLTGASSCRGRRPASTASPARLRPRSLASPSLGGADPRCAQPAARAPRPPLQDQRPGTSTRVGTWRRAVSPAQPPAGTRASTVGVPSAPPHLCSAVAGPARCPGALGVCPRTPCPLL